jgi:hypothetical protein
MLVINGGTFVFTKVGSKSVHSITPNEQKWLSMSSYMNAHGESIPSFYIFKVKQFFKNYIKQCESGSIMEMQPHAWMITCLFPTWISHFIATMQACGGNMSLENKHLLIIDCHNSHAIVDNVQTTKRMGLDLIILPSHTSHTLQQLDVSCFKLFKTTLCEY